MSKGLKILLFTLLLLVLLGWWASDNVLPYMVIKPFRSNPAHQQWRLPQGSRPADYGLASDAFDVYGKDSVLLKCLYLKTNAQRDTAGEKPLTILFLHGISGCKEHFLPMSQNLTQAGINVAVFDLRAHGQSGGEYCTFGFNEKYDVAAVVDELLRRDPNQKIGIWGNSLGGAIALQALALDKRLQFGVIESTFNTLENVVVEYGADIFQIKSFGLADYALRKAGKIAHFDPFSIQPCESARQITQPIFVAHGEQDHKIPIAFGLNNFDNIASKDKTWNPIPGADHTDLGRVGGRAYFEKLLAFLRKQH